MLISGGASYHKMSSWIFCLLTIFCSCASVDCYRILLMPFLQGSHSLWMSEVGRSLVSRGHECYAIVGPYRGVKGTMNKAGVKLLEYKLTHSRDMEQWLKDQAQHFAHLGIEGKTDAVSMTKYFMNISDLLMEDGIQLLKNNSNLLKKIEDLKFDMVVLDGIYFTMYNYIIPYKFNIPYVTMTTGWMANVMGVPSLPSIVPYQMFQHTDKMAFKERLFQLLFDLFGFLYVRVSSMPGDYLVPEVVPEKAELTLYELQRRSELFILDIAPPGDYPRPGLPHVIFVGGLTIKPAHEILDRELRNFVDSAKDGFILLSLGSYVSEIPPAMLTKFMELIKAVPQKVVWKYKDVAIKNPPANLKLIPWLPQNDLLGHENCKLFITHCGNNGLYEALYHGVPMLGFPFFGDQPYNCHRIKSLGYGLYLDVANFTSDELIKNTKDILYSQKYSEKAKLASYIMKDDKDLPVAKACHWIEHVIKFGSEHLRSSSIHMPWYQFWMFDVIITLLFILVFVVIIIIFICKCTWRCLKRAVGKVKKD